MNCNVCFRSYKETKVVPEPLKHDIVASGDRRKTIMCIQAVFNNFEVYNYVDLQVSRIIYFGSDFISFLMYHLRCVAICDYWPHILPSFLLMLGSIS